MKQQIKAFIHAALETCGGNHLARHLTRKQSKILMYHRIIEHPMIPAIAPAEFERQLAYLKRHFSVLPIDQLLRDRAAGCVKNNSIAITFDDGHYDFYENAWPLLKKYDLPATLYVTTAFVDRQCWLWPDHIKHIVWNTRKTSISYLGKELILTNNNRLDVWNIIASHCLEMENDERSEFIRALGTQLNINMEEEPSEHFRAVTWDQLREMVSEGLNLGSHTISHRILSKLPPKELETELAKSKLQIERSINSTITGICYPNGMKPDISEAVEKQAKSAGYQYGVAAYPTDVRIGNMYQVGRWSAPRIHASFRSLVNGITAKGHFSGEHV